jgi:hypothetical protein
MVKHLPLAEVAALQEKELIPILQYPTASDYSENTYYIIGTGFWAGMRVPTDEHGLL